MASSSEIKHCVLFDWGDTLMRVFPEYGGPMVAWPRVEAMPHAAETLRALRSRAVLALATNAADSEEAEIWSALRRAGLDTLLDKVYCQRRIGHKKPSGAFFDAVLADLGVPAAQVVLVGDDEQADVAGANACGIRAVWYNPRTAEERTSPLVKTVHDLRDLPGALEKFWEEETPMRWDELTSDLFPEAVAKAEGVCLVPLGCMERHAHHLPLGTDMFIAREICRRAAALEPAVVFPDFFLTQILEARHYPGCVGIEPDLILRLLDNACREIARNGLKKVVIVNAHGGNGPMLQFFAQMQLASPRDYAVYVADPHSGVAEDPAIKAQWETQVDGHAGESETSEILAARPELVRKDALRADAEGQPLERLKALRDLGVYTGIWWYADHPTHYRGDGRPATAEKGDRQLDATARALARAIRAIKDDTQTLRLQAEFFAAAAAPTLR